MNPRESGPWRSVEHGPGPNCQYEELEGEGDEEAVTVYFTLQLGVPHVHELRLWQDQHEDGAEEAENRESRNQKLSRVSLTGKPPALLTNLMLQLDSPVLHAEVRHARHSRVVCPVLGEHLHLRVVKLLIMKGNNEL